MNIRVKTLLLLGMMTTLPMFGQGTLTFLNTETGTGIPGGSPVSDEDGTRWSGSAYLAQLYAEITTGAFSAIGTPVPFRTGAAAGFVAATQVAVPGVAVGVNVNIMMRAWESSAGASYEAALAAGGKTAESNTISVGPLGGVPAVGPPITDPNLIGLQPFSYIPEPSAAFLALIGLGALLGMRRVER